MLLSFLKSAVRHLRRNPFYTLVNVLGLALGLACTFAITAHVRTELSYDSFQDEAVVRVATRSSAGTSAASPRPLAQELETHVPAVEAATRLSRERADRVLIARNERRFFESGFLFADSDVFDVLTISLKQGNSAETLDDPFSVILSESAAEKYFPTEDPVGKTIRVRLQGDRDVFDYTVTGVAEDLPRTSHLQFDFLASYLGHPMVGEAEDQENWLGLDVYTYARLEGDPEDVRHDLASFTRERVQPAVRSQAARMEDQPADLGGYDFIVQPIQSIHLHSNLLDELGPNGSFQDVLIFSAIALFVLLLACINFVNLTTARAASRAREIGIRKVLGSARKDVAAQFLLEAFLITGMAVGLGVLAAELAPRVIGTTWFQFDVVEPTTALIVAGLLLVVGIGAGWYPALYLSSLKPAAALKAEGGFLRGSRLRNGLVVVQIAVTTSLLICTAIVALQMQYVRKADLGFDRSSVVILEGTEVVRNRIEAFKEELEAHLAVESAANSEALPGHELSRARIHLQDDPEKAISASAMTVGFEFVETMGMNVIAGRSFSQDMAGDSTAVILNETAAAAIGPGPQSVVGEQVMSEGRPYVVVGVVEDYHQTSLRNAIGPTVLFGPDPWNENRPNQVVVVRVQSNEISEAMNHLQSVWSSFAPAEPMRNAFLDARLEAQYRRERRDGTYFAAFSIIAVAIACFGLVGLAGFTTESRSREIGIRKVHGATTTRVLRLFYAHFLKLTAAAFLLAVPVGFLVMQAWLDRFAYSISIDPIPFVYGAVLTLVMVLGATSYQVIRAARMNPVEILRQ